MPLILQPRVAAHHVTRRPVIAVNRAFALSLWQLTVGRRNLKENRLNSSPIVSLSSFLDPRSSFHNPIRQQLRRHIEVERRRLIDQPSSCQVPIAVASHQLRAEKFLRSTWIDANSTRCLRLNGRTLCPSTKYKQNNFDFSRCFHIS